jgi:hypothetical protein
LYQPVVLIWKETEPALPSVAIDGACAVRETNGCSGFGGERLERPFAHLC